MDLSHQHYIYITGVIFFNLLKWSLIFPVIFCFSNHVPALTSQSSINNVVSSLLSFYQTIRTCKVVSSQSCSDNEGLVPDDTTLYRRVLAHASLYHVATADSISSSSVSMISTTCRKFQTGCKLLSIPSQFFTAVFNVDTKILTAMLGQHMLQVHISTLKKYLFYPLFHRFMLSFIHSSPLSMI